MYALVRFKGDVLLFNRLGKTLPETIGRDTGICGEQDISFSSKPPTARKSSKRSSPSSSVEGEDSGRSVTFTHVFERSSDKHGTSNDFSNENTIRNEKMEFDMSLAIISNSASSDFFTSEMKANAQQAICRLQLELSKRNKASVTKILSWR